tara:strand:- start:138 stop:365 length:228 start_codon:yes stop_codon:yes gene_type:complete
MLINILRKFLFLIRVILIKDYYFKNTKSQNNNQENQFISYLSKFVKNKNLIRKKLSKLSAKQQYKKIKHLKFVKV